ncbi:ribonuclease H-like domain-containing protein [Tanacetum coccineum]
MCHKTTLASDTSIDFQIDFSISIGETVTHWFTLIVLSALRRSDNENMLSRSSRIRRILKDGGEVSTIKVFKRNPTRRLHERIGKLLALLRGPARIFGLNSYYRRLIKNFARIAQPLTLLTQKDKNFDWGEEQEKSFQTLKDALYSASILTLRDGLDNFVVYYDASRQGLRCVTTAKIVRTKRVIYTNHNSLQHIFDPKELNMRQRRWIELFNDYDCEIRYHLGKANMVADALSKKLKAPKEAFKDDNVQFVALREVDKQMEHKEDDAIFLFILDTAITKAGIKLLPHRAHFSCSWDTVGISTLKASAYLQHEHYALWEVIEFGDSYKAPLEETGKGVTDEGSAKKMGKTVAITTKDMQKRRNDVKAKTTLLLAVPNEHQCGIVSHLEFMDVPIKQDDLNQKFLSSLAPEWVIYTIVWRNRDDLDTMSLDDVYNHLKVYELEVQKKVSTFGVQVSTASTDVATTNLSHDTVCAYIATQPNGFRRRAVKKITIQGSDVAGFDKSKVECFNCHKIGHFARECRAPRVKTKEEEKATRRILSYIADEDENHALVANEEMTFPNIICSYVQNPLKFR